MFKANKKLKTITIISFVILITLMWLPLFTTWEPWHQPLSYAILVLTSTFSLFFVKNRKRSLLITIALAFGLVADYFLIILQGYQTEAMCAFSVSQLLFAIVALTFSSTKKGKVIQVVIRVVLTLLGVLVTNIVLKEGALPLYVISVAYYINMLLSMVIAFCHFKKGAFQKAFAIGLLLFALCDITVGFDFLINIFSLGPGNIIYDINNLPFKLSVFFYTPSQVVLSLSTKLK
ncbi:MAG: hypothetical protein IKL82_01830 [Clostridia bacterium]|nr:hypothetical protein [Clostridia bacterium]